MIVMDTQNLASPISVQVEDEFWINFTVVD